jgi:hypothetical protein
MGSNVPTTRAANTRLAAVIAEAHLTHGQVAREIVRVAHESSPPAGELIVVGRSHVSKWVAGVTPSAVVVPVLREVLSRLAGRVVTFEEIGIASPGSSGHLLDWHADTLVALADLGRVDVDASRRRMLGAAAFSLAASALPDDA